MSHEASEDEDQKKEDNLNASNHSHNINFILNNSQPQSNVRNYKD